MWNDRRNLVGPTTAPSDGFTNDLDHFLSGWREAIDAVEDGLILLYGKY